jgi:hypothetical protein
MQAQQQRAAAAQWRRRGAAAAAGAQRRARAAAAPRPPPAPGAAPPAKQQLQPLIYEAIALDMDGTLTKAHIDFVDMRQRTGTPQRRGMGARNRCSKPCVQQPSCSAASKADEPARPAHLPGIPVGDLFVNMESWEEPDEVARAMGGCAGARGDEGVKGGSCAGAGPWRPAADKGLDIGCSGAGEGAGQWRALLTHAKPWRPHHPLPLSRRDPGD